MRKVSGDELISIPLEEVSDVRSVKRRIARVYRVPRFRQKLVHDATVLEDGIQIDEPMEVTLSVLPWTTDSWEKRNELVDAAEDGLLVDVELMLQRPQNPNYPDQRDTLPLTMAASLGHADVVSLLLEAEADPSVQGDQAVYCAAGPGYTQIVQLLLDAHADTDFVDNHGDTALSLGSIVRV